MKITDAHKTADTKCQNRNKKRKEIQDWTAAVAIQNACVDVVREI